jgi:hypothetical protein
MVREHRVKRIAVFCVVALAALVWAGLAYPGSLTAYASDYELWEDCDWDGYDDHTGVAVPWPGFDGTRGDTPSGPSSDSQTGKKQAEEAAAKDDSSDSSSSSNSGSSPTSSTKKSTKSTKSTKKTTDSKTTTDTPTSDTEATGATIEEETPVEEPVAVTEPAATSAKSPEETAAELAAAQKAFDDAVIAQKGEVEVSDAEGAALHVGSSVIISGAGFYGDVAELSVEIHSDPVALGTAATDADGLFELEAVLPENIAEGAHNIVVLYKGAEIARRPIELGPAPADSFLKALTVGFGAGSEFLAGIIILAALVALSGLALALHAVVRRGRRAAATG